MAKFNPQAIGAPLTVPKRRLLFWLASGSDRQAAGITRATARGRSNHRCQLSGSFAAYDDETPLVENPTIEPLLAVALIERAAQEDVDLSANARWNLVPVRALQA